MAYYFILPYSKSVDVFQVMDSTLTVWSSESDDVNIASLVMLQASVGANSVFIDLPPDQRAEFDSMQNSTVDPAISSSVRIWPEGAAFYCTVIVLVLAVLFSQLHFADDSP